MLPPVFVKGHLKFTVDGHILEFLQLSISSFGVTGLPWAPLEPRKHFGREIEVAVRIPLIEPFNFRTPAFIMSENTVYSEHMVLKFLLDAATQSRLDEIVAKHGHYPTDYVRKYPRIPSAHTIQTFPLRALVMPILESGEVATGTSPLTFDVSNLSPNGILITTQNQMALSIAPGTRIHMLLEPRGWFPTPIEVEGLVCRVVSDIDPESKNIARHLGVKFQRVDDANKAAFLELLKDILERVKDQMKPPTGA